MKKMVVSHNIPALFSHLSMRRADRGVQQAMMRLSSGTRISSARDDAAGLAIANKLNYQVGGLERASENSTHGISLVQTAEGALSEVHNMIQRMRELAVQAANDTLTNTQKNMIQLEINQLTDEIQSISVRTEFNRMRLLNGEADRVTEMRTGFGTAGPLTRSIVTPLYFSNNINPGHLQYNIVAAGTHAVMPGVNPAPPQLLPANASQLLMGDPPNAGFRQGDLININGINVRVEADDTWGSFNLRVMQTFEYAGININRPQGLLYSNIAGSEQTIRISGDAGLLAGVGLPAGEVFGTCAEINGVELFDSLGNPVTGDLAVSTSGNTVFIRGTRGEDIRLNIQVDFNSVTNQHVFGNGNPVAPQNMTMVFRDFGPLKMQIGPNHNMAMSVQIPRLNSETLGFVEYVAGRRRNILNYANTEGATLALDITDRALHTVSQVRARLGAYQNRLEATVRSLDVAAEQTESSRSLIQDADMARESTRFAQFNVMFQSAMAMLGQANQRPQQLISLLQ